MQFTNLSLFALLALLSASVNAHNGVVHDDNLVPRPGDDRVPPVAPPVVPGQQPGDDNVVPRLGDDRGTNGTNGTTTRPSPTDVPTNSAMKNSMGTLGLASVFAFLMF